jgi:hypothetical protein
MLWAIAALLVAAAATDSHSARMIRGNLLLTMPTLMRDAFREHHRLTKSELEKVWKSCVFAFDTNVLLNIYRYADSTREDLFRVIAHLGDRVWVPYRVGEEFYSNRIGVIREQAAKYEQLTRAVQQSLTQLNDGAFRKSGFLHVTELQQVLEPAVKRATQILDDRKKSHPDLLHDDPYLERLVELIGPSIGSEPTPEQRSQTATEAQKRLDRQQPPGIGPDSRKDPPERYGDIFIWFELLQLGKAKNAPIVWVTDEIKEDWWQVVAGERLGPRPELRLEMRKAAGVEFYIYSPARLFELLATQPEVKVAPSSIDDAQKITEELQARNSEIRLFESTAPAPRDSGAGRPRELMTFARDAEEAVKLWLMHNRPDSQVERSREHRVDFVVSHQGKKTAVDVLAIRHGPSMFLRNRLKEAGYQAHYHLSSGRYDEYFVAVVAGTEPLAHEFINRVVERGTLRPMPNIVVGFIDDETGIFRAVTELAGDV